VLALGGRQRRTPPSHFAGIDGEQTGDAFEQRRLAGAIRPNQAEDLAGENTERYVGEHPLIAKGLTDPLHRHQDVGVR
jgi:hypothetical protein